MKKWTLQLRLTVIVGGIVLAACLLLTTNSIFSARSYYGAYAALIESGEVMDDPALKAPAAGGRALGTPSEFYVEASQKFSVQSLTAMALIVISALFLTYQVTGWILRPLKALTGAVGAMDDQNLSRRISAADARGEVLTLTESFNHMLSRLEDAFQMQKSFAGNAAHELKTPLAVIKSSLQVLEMAPNPSLEDYREFMEDTAQSLTRIIKTVEELLALSAPGSAPLRERVVPLDLVEQAMRELRAHAEEKGVSLSVIGSSEALCGNSGLLYRAVYNLIENAVKYNRPGGKVAVSLADENEFVRVTVSDTGIGIDEAALKHIFEPFYRADLSRSQQIPGSGLGLSVVKLIAERHGGGVEVESKRGEGSSFSLSIKKQ